MTLINATDLARNLSRVLDRLERGDEEIVIVRNNHAVGKLVPGAPRMTAAEALADLGGTLTPAEASQWKKDIAGFDRRAAREMSDPWAS
jgi:prevent-host-death family protein